MDTVPLTMSRRTVHTNLPGTGKFCLTVLILSVGDGMACIETLDKGESWRQATSNPYQMTRPARPKIDSQWLFCVRCHYTRASPHVEDPTSPVRMQCRVGVVTVLAK